MDYKKSAPIAVLWEPNAAQLRCLCPKILFASCVSHFFFAYQVCAPNNFVCTRCISVFVCKRNPGPAATHHPSWDNCLLLKCRLPQIPVGFTRVLYRESIAANIRHPPASHPPARTLTAVCHEGVGGGGTLSPRRRPPPNPHPPYPQRRRAIERWLDRFPGRTKSWGEPPHGHRPGARQNQNQNPTPCKLGASLFRVQQEHQRRVVNNDLCVLLLPLWTPIRLGFCRDILSNVCTCKVDQWGVAIVLELTCCDPRPLCSVMGHGPVSRT